MKLNYLGFHVIIIVLEQEIENKRNNELVNKVRIIFTRIIRVIVHKKRRVESDIVTEGGLTKVIRVNLST